MQTKPVLSVVVPMYNEQEVIAETCRRLTAALDAIGEPYEVILVNDGSRDQTAAIVRSLLGQYPSIRLVDLARNFGQESAVSAGLKHASGEAVVLIDADLQDPPEAIPEMMKLWREGFDVVYGQRRNRQGDTALKKGTAYLFYRVLAWLSGVNIPKDTGHFRLMDRKVVEVINAMPEHNRLLRGMVAWVGFKQTPYVFDRDERWAGETKYTYKAMFKLAVDGIYSFSGLPLRLPLMLGVPLAAAGAVLLILWAIFGWGAAVGNIFVSLTLGGIVLMCLGFMGEYISRALDEVRGRPLYIVRTLEGFPDADKESSN